VVRDLFLGAMDLLLRALGVFSIDGVTSVIGAVSSSIAGGGVSVVTGSVKVSASHGTVRVIPTEGKNFLQLTFLVILGSSPRSSSISTPFTEASEMVEFSSAVAVPVAAAATRARAAVTQKIDGQRSRIALAMVFSINKSRDLSRSVTGTRLARYDHSRRKQVRERRKAYFVTPPLTMPVNSSQMSALCQKQT
jgi:hypothetical protein